MNWILAAALLFVSGGVATAQNTPDTAARICKDYTLGHYDAARQGLTGILWKDFDPSRLLQRICARGLTEEPQDGYLHYGVGRMMLRLKEFDAAERLFEAAVANGALSGYSGAAYLYAYEPDFKRKDPKRAYDLALAGDRAGDTGASCTLAYMFHGGVGTAKSPALAAKYAKRSVRAGHEDCLALLGYFHFEGLGVAQDPHEAFRLYSKAAPWDQYSQEMLAHMYEEGIGTKRDPAKAQSWRALAGQSTPASTGGAAAGGVLPSGEEIGEIIAEEALKWAVRATLKALFESD